MAGEPNCLPRQSNIMEPQKGKVLIYTTTHTHLEIHQMKAASYKGHIAYDSICMKMKWANPER